MPVNPYEPPKEDAPEPRLPTAAQERRQPWYVGFCLVWTAFIVLTSTYADNLRYFSTPQVFLAYAALVGGGNIASLICLWRGVRGWWHLLFLPIWFLSSVEVLIVLTYAAIVFQGGPR